MNLRTFLEDGASIAIIVAALCLAMSWGGV